MQISTQFWNSLIFRDCVYSTLLTYIVPLLDNTLGNDLFSLVLHRCFIAIQKCLGLYSENGQYSTDDVDRLCTFYSSLKKEYGWSSVVKVNYLKLFLFFLCSFMLNCWVLRAHNSILIYVVFIRSILQH